MLGEPLLGDPLEPLPCELLLLLGDPLEPPSADPLLDPLPGVVPPLCDELDELAPEPLALAPPDPGEAVLAHPGTPSQEPSAGARPGCSLHHCLAYWPQ